MYIRQSKKGWQLAAVALCTLPVIAIVPGCGGGGYGNSINAVQYTGTYTGTYSGSEIGNFKYTINSNGAIVATITSPSLGVVTGTGTLKNSSFSFAGTSATVPGATISFTGAYHLSSGVQTPSGTWQTSTGLSGTFTGAKALGAATPTPGPTFTPGPTATPTPPGNQYAGRYTGSVTLNTNPVQNATLNFTINGNSSVGGTLQQSANSQVSLAGSANSSTGAIALNGSVVDASNHIQSIALNGRLLTQNGATTVVNAVVRTAGLVNGTWAATKR